MQVVHEPSLRSRLLFYAIPLNSFLMIPVFHMNNVSALCVEIMEMYGWMTFKCVIAVALLVLHIAI